MGRVEPARSPRPSLLLSSCSPPAHSYSRASHLQRARTILTSLKKTKTAQFASPALPTPPPALALTTKFCHSLIAKTFLTYIRNDKQCHFRNMNNPQAPHSQKEIKFFPEMRGWYNLYGAECSEFLCAESFSFAHTTTATTACKHTRQDNHHNCHRLQNATAAAHFSQRCSPNIELQS